MRSRGTILLAALLAACGTEDAGDEVAQTDDAAVSAEDAGDVLEGPEIEHVRVEAPGLSFDIFKYEASHPQATATEAWPGARDGADAPEGAPQSVAGVMPWHSIRHRDAVAACEALGWRLCSGEELQRACEGPSGTAYTYGDTFMGGACNFREAYRAEGDEGASAAPTGHFEACVSAEGAYDLNGNLWEWTSDRDEGDGQARFYQGAGWRTIAERHRDHNLVCAEKNKLLRISAPSYANEDVGFRCCRNAGE